MHCLHLQGTRDRIQETIYQSTRRHIPEDSDLRSPQHGNLNSILHMLKIRLLCKLNIQVEIYDFHIMDSLHAPNANKA
jgi:hypothetical protein